MARIIFIFFLLCSSICYADLYYWTDESGVKHITNTKPDTKAENIKTIKESAHSQNEPAVSKDSIKTKPVTIQNKAKVKTSYNQNQEVVMYSTQRCGFCRKAKSFFSKNNIKYTEYDVGTSKAARKKYNALNGKGVPLIYVGNQRISGFNEPAIRNALGLKK